MTKHVTLLFLRREGEILLAMKKRGFGEGKWNGVGGKVEAGESWEEAAARECEEEIGVRVKPAGLTKVCELDFWLTNDPDFNNFAHVYTAEQWQGEPHETDEMRPQWFALKDIPYDKMWGDDHVWLPKVLTGKRLRAQFTTDEHNQIVDSELAELQPEEKF